MGSITEVPGGVGDKKPRGTSQLRPCYKSGQVLVAH